MNFGFTGANGRSIMSRLDVRASRHPGKRMFENLAEAKVLQPPAVESVDKFLLTLRLDMIGAHAPASVQHVAQPASNLCMLSG